MNIEKISPLYENPAYLPDVYEESWNTPFLNLVLKGNTALDIEELHQHTQAIEKKLGRISPYSRWSPRTIDIDILAVEGLSLNRENLKSSTPFDRREKLCSLSF